MSSLTSDINYKYLQTNPDEIYLDSDADKSCQDNPLP